MHMPLVAFSNNVVGMDDDQQFDQVGFDDFSGMLYATRHLIGKGHRQIVFAGDVSYPWLYRRFEGYRQAMREKKLRPILIKGRSHLSFGDFGQESVGRATSNCRRSRQRRNRLRTLAIVVPARRESARRNQSGRIRRS